MAKEIPVYLFVGFLESGKTKFIQETFEDPNFDSGDKTLLLICEEGEEEYNPKKFAFPGVTVKVIEDKAEMNPQNLAKLEKESGAGRVVIEYNGMWLLQELADALPENYTYFYTCGPEPMLKAVYRATNTSGQMSFEERMGCGFGACMGCSCKTITGYKRICKDGPVMKKEEILWEA